MIKKPVNTLTGIVLNISPYEDDSAIVVLGTENGLMSFVSKHLYKLNSSIKPLSNIGTVVNIDYRQINDNINSINYAKSLLEVTSFYSSLSLSSFLFFLAQLSLLLFSEGDYYPINQIYFLLKLLKKNADPLTISLLVVGTFYKSLGLNQDISKCAKCHSTHNIVSFDLKNGGFICKNCLAENLIRRDNDELYIFKFVFSQLNEEVVKRKVPKHAGIKLLKELTQYLLEYYDLKKCESLELFINSLI